MQLSLLIGAIFIATCVIQVQASDKKNGKPVVYGFTSDFLDPKPKKGKNSSSPKTAPTNQSSEQETESKNPTPHIPVESLFGSLNLQSSPSENSLMDQNVHSNDKDKKPSTSAPKNIFDIPGLQKRIDKLVEKIKRKQNELKDEKILYDNLVIAVKEMDKKLNKTKVSDPVDSNPSESLDEYFVTFKDICNDYHKQNIIVSEKIVRLRELESELITAKMNKLLKIAEISSPKLVEKPLELESSRHQSCLEKQKKMIGAMFLESCEIAKMKSYWEKEIQTILNKNKDN